MGEFDLIARYFTRPAQRSPLGVGDDCALLAPAPGMQLAVKGAGAEPLEPGIKYRVLAKAGSRKLECDFVPVPQTH